MFKCQLCKQVTPAKTKAQRIVLETRPRTYIIQPPKDKQKGPRQESPRIYYGYETVREAIACPVCAAAYNLQKDKA
jgi:hypothetical protein